VTAPPVRLGHVGTTSVTATVFGLLDRGCTLRPDLAAQLDGRIRLRFAEDYADVRIECAPEAILVMDDDDAPVDLEIRASLPDFVLLLAAPLAKGLPKPTDRRGRAALARVADGRIELTGSVGTARRLLRVMSVSGTDA
jgi:hypothetical protein